jgi:hypothetical protein
MSIPYSSRCEVSRVCHHVLLPFKIFKVSIKAHLVVPNIILYFEGLLRLKKKCTNSFVIGNALEILPLVIIATKLSPHKDVRRFSAQKVAVLLWNMPDINKIYMLMGMGRSCLFIA